MAARVDVLAARLDESVRQADLDQEGMFVSDVERLIELINQQFTSSRHEEGWHDKHSSHEEFSPNAQM